MDIYSKSCCKQAQLESFQTFHQMCLSQANQKRKIVSWPKSGSPAHVALGGSCQRQKAAQRCWETYRISSYRSTGSFSFNDAGVSSKAKAFQLQGYGDKNTTINFETRSLTKIY